MKTVLIATAAFIAISHGTSFAKSSGSFAGHSGWNVPVQSNFDSTGVGRSVLTPRGFVVTTGRVGDMMTTTLPGGGQGLMTNNGNGTSTLISPGSMTTVPTPQ